MEGHLVVTREELYHVQMDVKHVQAVQINHTDRLLRLEKRQADDAALKSVWTSPFPSVLSGTPQQGTIQTPNTNVFDDFDDEQGHNLIGSVHLDNDEEPVRRGASRANSVRFDVSAIHGPNWASGSRSSGEFGPARPSSGIGSHAMTERSFSHKSDGRYSSAGHSNYSGRTNSLGLDTNFLIGGENDSCTLDIPEPPPGLFVLGSVPSIIRCWLSENFSHSALLYAVVCTGSQKSVLEFSMVRELGLEDSLQKSPTGVPYIRLPIYLPEAIVTRPSSRANSPAPQLPTLTANFEIHGHDQKPSSEFKKTIQVFIGSDTLRAHNADLLFSQNMMTIYGDDRNKLSVPFVRPEDDSMFKNICTTNIQQQPPKKTELKATSVPFRPNGQKADDVSLSKPRDPSQSVQPQTVDIQHIQSHIGPSSPLTLSSKSNSNFNGQIRECEPQSETLFLNGKPGVGIYNESETLTGEEINEYQAHNEAPTENQISNETARTRHSERRGSLSGIWGSWRSAGASSSNENEVSRENSTLGSYSRASRGGRSMKVLKPIKVSQTGRTNSTARTGAAYEPPAQRPSTESRRKSQGATEGNGGIRWEPKRRGSEEKASRELKLVASSSRSSNPIGGASAFAWMTTGKPKVNSTAIE